MRKTLLSTTAIFGASTAIFGATMVMPTVAAAQEATPMELKITGYGKEELFIVEQDGITGVGSGVHMESDDFEVQFNANAVADNGLSYGAKIEFDIDATTTDEARIRFSGSWGIIDLGDDDGAEDAMGYGPEDLNSGQGGWDGGEPISTLSIKQSDMEMAGDTSDATKITYYTPRFAGFQAGVSYTPDTGASMGAGIAHNTLADMRNHWGFGANYVETFGDFDVRLHATGVYSDMDNDTVSTVGSTTLEDAEGYKVGLGLGFAGFSVGLGYVNNGETGMIKGDGSDAGSAYGAGAGYSTGPWTVGVTYVRATADNATGAGNDNYRAFAVGGNYTLAPGLDVYTEYLWAKVKSPDNTTTDGSGLATVTKNDGQSIMIGTKVTF